MKHNTIVLDLDSQTICVHLGVVKGNNITFIIFYITNKNLSNKKKNGNAKGSSNVFYIQIYKHIVRVFSLGNMCVII